MNAWENRAVCADADPKLFDAIDAPGDALSYCDRCPVVTECLAAVAKDFDGIAAGAVWLDGKPYNPEGKQLRKIPCAPGHPVAREMHRRRGEKCDVGWIPKALPGNREQKEGWSDGDLRRAHFAYDKGDRSSWARRGERIYRRVLNGRRKQGRRRDREGSTLNNTELDIMALAAHGHGNIRVAKELGLPLGTVQEHMKNIFYKLTARDRAHALANAFRTGQLVWDDSDGDETREVA